MTLKQQINADFISVNHSFQRNLRPLSLPTRAHKSDC
jgi:hypothetical protein